MMVRLRLQRSRKYLENRNANVKYRQNDNILPRKKLDVKMVIQAQESEDAADSLTCSSSSSTGRGASSSLSSSDGSECSSMDVENETETDTDPAVSNIRIKGEHEELKKVKVQGHALNDNEGGVRVLQEALSLFCQQMTKTKHNSKVVDYLSPEQMLESLFSKDGAKHGSLSLSAKTKPSEDGDDCQHRTKNLIQAFQQIQQYSVNTHHPYFFNQLFGALDPVALAAELIALSVHTSAYTWETAPVFTLMEREVMRCLGRLVFEGKSPEDDEESHGTLNGEGDADAKVEAVEYDGLMLPGGALSNLTALHVARYYVKSRMTNKGTDKSMEDVGRRSNVEEEKEEEEESSPTLTSDLDSRDPELVAFVSSEAHYSFAKAVSVTGIRAHNLIVVPTLQNGQMDVNELDRLMEELQEENLGLCRSSASHPKSAKRVRIPFFVAATAGSTVRGSFDDIEAIVQVCRKHEDRLNSSIHSQSHPNINPDTGTDTITSNEYHRIWVHIDGAWGGSAIFSQHPTLQNLMKGIQHVDSFTFNPHKLIGAPQQTTAFITRHSGILKAANSNGAKYLFDPRKNGAKYDLGDVSYTCGRRTDAIKLWAQWKYYGTKGIGRMVESKLGALEYMAQKIRKSDRFMLACEPWPFNVNFFYLPPRLRQRMAKCEIDLEGDNPIIPSDISEDLADVSVELKLRLHRSGEMLIPFQPLSNQKADCFRVVLAGNKPFDESDTDTVLRLMDKYGHDL